MKLTISNIAWNPAEDEAVAGLLQRYGVNGVEIAPTKLWPQPLQASKDEVNAYARFWRQHGLQVSSMQALLFGRPDLTIFENAAKRAETLDYLTGMMRIARWLGAGVLVFGSPKNRLVGELATDTIQAIAVDFFSEVAKAAEAHETLFCIEPNPVDYGCDFVTDSHQGRDLVAQVNHPGFGLHLDAAAMTLSGEDIENALTTTLPGLCHFHISEPNLAPIGTGGVEHSRFAKTLQTGGYQGWFSIEMRPPGGEANVAGIDDALQAAHRYYLSEGDND